MLIAAGPGVGSMQDITNHCDYRTMQIRQVQGDTLDTFDCTFHDPLSNSMVCAEDDIVCLDENDPNGWPTVNLIANPNMGGTYVSGIAPSWTLDNPQGGTGIVGSKITTNTLYGSCQQLTFTSTPSGCDINVQQQNIPLPADESGDAIRIPMCFSGWYRFDTNYLNSGANTGSLKINWLQANGSYISTSAVNISVTAEYANVWRRFSVIATPPSNAFKATVYFQAHTVAVTTGTVKFTGAQFEYCTFQNVYLNNPGLAIKNPTMQYHGTGGVVDEWGGQTNGGTGGTFSVVTSPSLYGTAQQIAYTNATLDLSIEQGFKEIPINNDAAYEATLTYQVTGALSANLSVWFQIGFRDATGSWITSAYIQTAQGLGVSGGWQQLTISFGPGGTDYGPMPSNTVYAALQAGLNATSTTNSGTVVFGSFTVTPLPLALQPSPTQTIVTALQAGVYPTPYCDNGTTGGAQAGCYTDSITGYYFRELRLFGGFIKTLDYDYTSSEPESDMILKATEYGIMMQEAPCTLVVRAQQDSAAIAAVATYAQNLGFLEGMDFTTFVQSIDTIDAKVFNWQTVRDAMSSISSDTVAAYYTDYYKRVHYAPALATVAPFGVSDTPDFSTTYPLERWHYTDDSTASVTTPVVEGTVQPSSPQTFSATGNGSTTAYTLNGGSAVAQVTSCTVNGVTKKVGVQSTNNFSDGYDALLDPTKGILTFASAPPNTQPVVVLYWFYAPVIVRLHDPAAESKTATAPYIKTRQHGRVIRIRRKISSHTQDTTIDSKNSAIDAANATLTVYAQPRPVATMNIRTPPAPVATSLRPGMAIPITHVISGLTATLFQIQEITLRPMGNGQIIREMKLGQYRPTFIIQMAHRHRAVAQTSEFSGTPLLDVLTLSDGWAITDSISHTVQNVGVWGGSTSSTWNGTFVWG